MVEVAARVHQMRDDGLVITLYVDTALLLGQHFQTLASILDRACAMAVRSISEPISCFTNSFSRHLPSPNMRSTKNQK